MQWKTQGTGTVSAARAVEPHSCFLTGSRVAPRPFPAASRAVFFSCSARRFRSVARNSSRPDKKTRDAAMSRQEPSGPEQELRDSSQHRGSVTAGGEGEQHSLGAGGPEGRRGKAVP